jgi:Na+-transporting methylmalonyl-CoA/oxaloacetate decarboxylase gamma subunit
VPAVIDSSPECVQNEQVYSADDVADFVVGDNYQECAGFMTFGPGATYGEEGVGAEGAYMVLTWIGIVFMVLVLVAWTLYENRRLLTYAAARLRGTPEAAAAAAADESELR